jgi:phage terminase large subunit-like protein
MLFNTDFNVLVIATKQEVAKNLVTKVRVMHELLPSWLRSVTAEDNRLSLRLANGSQIKAIASSPDAGRSEALSLLVFDECQPYDTKITVRDNKTGEIKEINIGELYENINYE